MKTYLITILLSTFTSFQTLWAQTVTGTIKSESDKKAIAYVNIASAKRNFGTVSDAEGKYNIQSDKRFENDTIIFSCIGYEPLRIKVADLKARTDKTIFLKEKQHTLSDVTIKRKKVKEKILGITTKSILVTAGFLDEPNNQKGNEVGIMIHTRKKTYIKSVNINVAYCPYDTFFYRLNIYKVGENMNLESVLSEPIYINLPKDQITQGLSIDLRQKYIVVNSDFLITVENIKNEGNSTLSFCAVLGRKTYYRKNSQSEWQTIPVGISINVVVDVEQ